MQDAGRASETTLYDDDFYTWTQRQAAHIRGGNLVRVDFENIAEEIESLGKSQESELQSRYKGYAFTF